MIDIEQRFRAMCREVWDDKRDDGFEEYFASDVVRHDPAGVLRGRGATQAALAELRSRCSELRYVVHETVRDGDRLAARWTVHGRHTGEVLGVAATGRNFTIEGHSMSHWRDGKIIENWVHWDPDKLVRDLRARDGYAEVDDTQLYYLREGVGRPMLCVHGGSGLDHTYFRPWIDGLDGRAERIYFDLRDCGRSRREPEKPITMELLAHDADALTRRLNVDRFVLLGHSFGGCVAQQLAALYPERIAGLILISTTAIMDYPEAIISGATTRATTPEMVETFTQGLTRGIPNDDVAFEEMWRKIMPLYFHRPNAALIDAVCSRIRFSASAAIHGMPQFAAFDSRERLAQLRVPTLIVSGADDFITPAQQAERLHRLIGGSSLSIIDGAGHYPFIEQPGDTLAVISRWLDRLP